MGVEKCICIWAIIFSRGLDYMRVHFGISTHMQCFLSAPVR